MSKSFMDYYALLDLAATATTDEIKHAWRRKIAQQHPDRTATSTATEEAEEATRLLNDAKSVLLDRTARAKYDAEWRQRQPRPSDLHSGARVGPARGWASADTTTAPPATSTTQPTIWTGAAQRQPAATRPRSSGWGDLFAAGAALLAVGGVAYLAANANEYDPSVDRYRARDGRFRRSRLF